MDSLEISIARAYLAASGQDPVTALIRSVKDLARTRRLLADIQIGAAPISGPIAGAGALRAYSAACAGAITERWPTSANAASQVS